MFNPNEIREGAGLPLVARHPWWALEEFTPDGGMWVIPPAPMRDWYATQAAALMADPAAFTAAMRHAVQDWPKSCANALAAPGLNLRAWFGQAGCYLATEAPNDATRLAWHQLDAGQQTAANAAADTVITEYRIATTTAGHPALWED